MTKIELKNILMHKIASIDDEAFSNAIYTIVNPKSETTIYKTSEIQKAQVKEGKEQIENGDYLINDQVETEINQWLNEK